MNIDEIVSVVKQQLNAKLIGSLNNEQIISILNTTISAAFDKASKEDHKRLYKTLSLVLHPDRLNTNTEQFAIYLKSREMSNVPQQILTAINESPNKNIIDAALESPTFLSEKLQIFVEAIWNKQDEYPKYLRYLTKTLTVLLVITAFILFFPIMGVRHIFSLPLILVQGLANKVTSNGISNELANYKDNYPLEYGVIKIQYARRMKDDIYSNACVMIDLSNSDVDGKRQEKQSSYSEIYDKSDEDFLGWFETQAQLTTPTFKNETLINQLVIESGLNKVKLTALAFHAAITKPGASLLSKIFLTVTAGILIPITALLQIIQKAIINPVFNVILPILLVAIPVAVLAAIVAPLYVKDYLVSKLNNLRRAATPATPASTPSQASQQEDTTAERAHVTNNPEVPKHFATMFSTAVPLTKHTNTAAPSPRRVSRID